MPIRYQYSDIVKTTPEKAFAAIDDLPFTPRWLAPCVSLDNITGSPNKPGDRLRYVFKEGGRQSEMEGVISDRVTGQRLHCVYQDDSFTVSVDMRVQAAPGGTLMTHTLEITPKTWFGTLLWPLIRMGLGSQTRAASDKLKKILETNGHPVSKA